MKRIAFILSVLSFQLTGFSQLGVGTNTPDASAQLDLAATDKGFLAPRIALTSATDVSTIATPATGLMIYNTATAGTSPNNVIPGYHYYDGTKWVRFINAQPSATISFSTADPNSGSPTFTPNTSQNTGYIYVSAINSSLWVWNGSTYVSYEAPSTTPFYLTGSTTDAGGNKTSDIYRTGSIGVGTSSPSKLLDVVNTASSYAGLIEAEGAVNNSYSRGMAIRMRRGTSASPTAIQLNDISAYGFAGYDGTSFSTTSAGIGGIATQNWTSTAKGMGLIFSTTSNSTTTLTERMRIDHNGNVGIRTSTPATTLHMNSNLAATNTINVDGQMLRMMRPQAPYVKWENIAQFNLGSYGVAPSPNTNAFTRLDLALNDGEGVATTTVMTWLANGNVGIGTSSPNGGLTLYGPQSLALPSTIHGLSGATKELVFGKGGITNNFAAITGVENGQYGGGLSFIVKSSGSNNFPTNAIQAMVLDWNGNMGVGTSSPSQRLDVNGTGLFRNGNTGSSNTNNQLLFGYSSTNTYQHAVKTRHNNVSATNNAIDFYLWSNTDAVSAIGSKHVMTLEATGNVGIGLTAPTQSLDVNGRVRIRTIDTGVATDSVLVVNGGVVKSVAKGASVNIQTANYTLTATDNGNIVIMNSASAVTVTVPATLPAGFVVQIIQKGAGQITVTGSGSTINSANGLKSRTLNSAIGVVMETSTLGYVTGDSNF